ncbi:MAG: nitroreductase [Thermodesulfovibrionia bacterium]|nr:nitroreductase [Thermodesulfovibrionia bacterium]MCK5287070.1 nitroreductase [Thermodesulfovibrionia bacterium]MCK5512176.1 nitroreductase [Thermodesulfovibrionia bacterium]
MSHRNSIQNETLKAIHTRRSVRVYESNKVSKDNINTIVEAGNNAPSAMNSQPWRFVVVEDETLHKEMVKTAIPNAKKILEHVKTLNPERYQQIMKRYEELEDPIYYSAPAIIFVIGSGIYADLSCPLACENMMLAAFSIGLGSCWVQFGSLVTDNEEIKKALDLKEDEKIFGPIVIGYPKVIPEPPEKKAPEITWL